MSKFQNVSATELIRSAVHARNVKFNLSGLARDLEINVAALENFLTGKALPAEILQALTKIIWAGHREYIPATDSFKPVFQEPPLPMTGLPVLDVKLPKYRAGAAQRAHSVTREAQHSVGDDHLGPRRVKEA